MKNIRLYISLLCAILIMVVIILKPQYSEAAIKGLLLLLGEQQCICE